MLRAFRPAVSGLLLLALSACATGERLSAASDVHGLLVSIRDNDRNAFDAHIDRTALEAEIQAVMVRQSRAAGAGEGLTGLSILASGPLSRVAAGLVLRPDVFRAIADYYGYNPERPLPGTVRLAAALTPVSGGRVCAKDARTGVCLLTFAQEAGTWRLVAFDASSVLAHPKGSKR
jgi:hypothetical protein